MDILTFLERWFRSHPEAAVEMTARESHSLVERLRRKLEERASIRTSEAREKTD
jgi:hypothetical protein